MKVELTQICKQLEAYETPRWAVEALLDVEILTRDVLDPCVGLGSISNHVGNAGYIIAGIDVQDWRKSYDCIETYRRLSEFKLGNFLDVNVYDDLAHATVIMNPPFTLACEFVDRAKALGARKIICFQRQAWRESQSRREWWQANRPARVWVCGARATCWRFDMLECQHEGGKEACDKKKVCQHCSAGSSVAMAWYVWEVGHTGAEITNAIYPKTVAA